MFSKILFGCTLYLLFADCLSWVLCKYSKCAFGFILCVYFVVC
jgi:hypothetical protein